MRLRNGHVLFQTNDLCWENSERHSVQHDLITTVPELNITCLTTLFTSLQYDQQLRSGETQEPGAEEMNLYWTTMFYSDLDDEDLSSTWFNVSSFQRTTAEVHRLKPKDEEMTCSDCDQHASSTYEHGELNIIHYRHDMLTTWWTNNQWTKEELNGEIWGCV